MKCNINIQSVRLRRSEIKNGEKRINYHIIISIIKSELKRGVIVGDIIRSLKDIWQYINDDNIQKFRDLFICLSPGYSIHQLIDILVEIYKTLPNNGMDRQKICLDRIHTVISRNKLGINYYVETMERAGNDTLENALKYLNFNMVDYLHNQSSTTNMKTKLRLERLIRYGEILIRDHIRIYMNTTYEKLLDKYINKPSMKHKCRFDDISFIIQD
jgi:hypothetical protein